MAFGPQLMLSNCGWSSLGVWTLNPLEGGQITGHQLRTSSSPPSFCSRTNKRLLQLLSILCFPASPFHGLPHIPPLMRQQVPAWWLSLHIPDQMTTSGRSVGKLTSSPGPLSFPALSLSGGCWSWSLLQQMVMDCTAVACGPTRSLWSSSRLLQDVH